MEELVVADIAGMAENTGGLSLFTNENGGIRDDCIINNAGDCLYIVSNAGCADKIAPLMEVILFFLSSDKFFCSVSEVALVWAS